MNKQGKPLWRLAGGSLLALATGAVLAKPLSAEAVFVLAKPSVLKVSTYVGQGDKPAAHGSAFLVDGQGYAVTNYHVVERSLRKPALFRLEASLGDEPLGPATVVALDVVHDLAIIRVARAAGRPYLPLGTPSPDLPRGANMFAMGAPLDLGLTITAGHFNGAVHAPGQARIHYSGTLNPGMSGGPALDEHGQVVGVNAARSTRGEQVGFLVPVAQARALYQRARANPPPAWPADDVALWHEIGAQLLAHQARWSHAALAARWHSTRLGPYRPVVFDSDQLACRSGSNEAATPRPPSTVQTLKCTLGEPVELGDEVQSGLLWYRHRLVDAGRLSDWQMAHQLDEHLRNGLFAMQSQEMARQVCTDQELAVPADAPGRPRVRLIWCAQPYRQMPGLFDVVLATVTRDSARRALVSHLGMEGVSWPTAQQLTRRFLEVQP